MALPEWLEPMAATLTQDRFATDDWVFERKLDGIRLLAFKDGNDVRLLSRNRLSHNHHYPDVVKAVAALPVSNAILDGEAMGVWREQDEVGLHVFDILWLDGEDLTAAAARRPPHAPRRHQTATAPLPCRAAERG